MSVYYRGNVSRFRGPSRSYRAAQSRWQDWANMIVGTWLIAAPWVIRQIGGLEYSNPGIATNMLGIGVALIVMCLWALGRPAAAVPEWISMVCGAWLVITPWALGFTGTMWAESMADWVIGAVITLTAITAASHTRRALS
jgi:hypothetical protein